MMIEFILTEAEVSGEEDSDHEIVDITDNIEDVDITEDNDFIDDRPINDEDDVHFYHQSDNRHNRIMPDDEYEEEEEMFYEIPNSENAKVSENDIKIEMPERMKFVYGTDEYEWNHHKLPRVIFTNFRMRSTS